ncbi:hypothetical protein [Halobaculum sp. EA56]|uniref:hypothetical protein n=1 Tax=Halobaculum sp. EA56 TaxID=3421648 RepID=UPI003EB81DCB
MDYIVGEEHLAKFRDDMKSAIYRHSSLFNSWDISEPDLRSKAKDGFERAHSSNWNVYTMMLSLIGIIFSLLGFGGYSLFLTVISVLIGVYAFLHKVTVDLLLYWPPFRGRIQFLKFKAVWNDAVMTTWKAPAILLIGLAMRVHYDAYKIGLAMIEEHILLSH